MSVISFQDANALLLYRVGPVLVCSSTLSVESVVMPPKVTATPGSSRTEPGVFKSIHGMVRIVDLRSRFGVDDDDRESPGRIIVVEVEGGRVGFWVDEIEDVIKTPGTGWGQLPTHIPREVFSRTLVSKKGIRLFAEFEYLNKFRSTGYLRKHIEKIKAAALIKSAKASAQIKRTNNTVSKNRLTKNNIPEESQQENIVIVPVVNDAPHGDKEVLKPTADSANKISPLRTSGTLFKSDNEPQQKGQHIKAETIAIKTRSNKTDQQRAGGSNFLSEKKIEKKPAVKQEYVTNRQKTDEQQENNRANASASHEPLSDYPKDHSFLWMSAVIVLLIIGFVVLVDVETLITDGNKFPNDIAVNKVKTMEYERKPAGSEEQQGLPGLPEEIADMAKTKEQSLLNNGNDSEVMDAEEIADISNTERQKKPSVEERYIETESPDWYKKATGGIAENSEAGKVVITKNKENIYIVIDDYDLKADGIESMAESKNDLDTRRANMSGEMPDEIPDETQGEKIEPSTDKYTKELLKNKSDTNKDALLVFQSAPGLFAETEEIKRQEYNDNIKKSDKFEQEKNTKLTITSEDTTVARDMVIVGRSDEVEAIEIETSQVEFSKGEQLNDSVNKYANKTSIDLSENVSEDLVVDKTAIDLLAEAGDEAQKLSSKTSKHNVQAGVDININADSASAVTTEAEVISEIETGAVDKVTTGIDINDDAGNKTRGNSGSGSGDITAARVKDNAGNNAGDNTRDVASDASSDASRDASRDASADELIITKPEAPMVENQAVEKTSRRHVHIVVKGDTLWHIAKSYVNNPWRYPELARLSKIKNPDLIYPGNKVIITINYKNKSQVKK